MSLFVNAVFQSIQGESSRAGWPCTFIRLGGCNLRCRWCDTTYAYNEGSHSRFADLLARIEALPPTRLVQITGGEPLLQPQASVLANTLADRGRTVLVETNGSIDIRVLAASVAAIVDIKCPSSGEADKMDLDNLKRLRPLDEVKFVIADEADYAHMLSLLPRIDTLRNTVNASPVFGVLDPAQLVAWIAKDRLDVRLNLQLHKHIWNPDARNV